LHLNAWKSSHETHEIDTGFVPICNSTAPALKNFHYADSRFYAKASVTGSTTLRHFYACISFEIQIVAMKMLEIIFDDPLIRVLTTLNAFC